MKINSTIALSFVMLLGLGAKANNIETAAKAFESLVAKNAKCDTFCIKLNEKGNTMSVFVEVENEAVVFDLDGQKELCTYSSTKDEKKVKGIDFDGRQVVIKRAGWFRDSKKSCSIAELREDAVNDADTKSIDLDGLGVTAIEKALIVALEENKDCKSFRVIFDSKKQLMGVVLLDANIAMSFDLQSENPDLRIFDRNPPEKIRDISFEVNKDEDGKDVNQIVLYFADLGKLTKKYNLKTGECVYSKTGFGLFPTSKLYS